MTEEDVITRLKGLTRGLEQSVSLHFFLFDELLLTLQVLELSCVLCSWITPAMCRVPPLIQPTAAPASRQASKYGLTAQSRSHALDMGVLPATAWQACLVSQNGHIGSRLKAMVVIPGAWTVEAGDCQCSELCVRM